MSQTELTRDPTERAVVHHDTDDRRIVCPDCGQDCTATKGGQDLPADAPAERVHGWQCRACANTFPCSATGPEAAMYTDRILGVELTYRDGSEPWAPVPEGSVAGDARPATDRAQLGLTMLIVGLTLLVWGVFLMLVVM